MTATRRTCLMILLAVAAASLLPSCRNNEAPIAVEAVPAAPEPMPSMAEPEKPADRPSLQFVEHMPLNSDQRCFGIAIAIDALLEGQLLPGERAEPVEVLASRIYKSLASGERLRYSPRMSIDKVELPIDAPEALEALSTAVAELYKPDYDRATETTAGVNRLIKAESESVLTVQALDGILSADPDHLEVFFASGNRRFPDGSSSPTSHVVLIGLAENGSKFVYDPNEPGKQIACTFVEYAEGVIAEWRCVYRDAGETTTQRYFLVPKDDYMRHFFASDLPPESSGTIEPGSN